jgi:hypothetical protein
VAIAEVAEGIAHLEEDDKDSRDSAVVAGSVAAASRSPANANGVGVVAKVSQASVAAEDNRSLVSVTSADRTSPAVSRDSLVVSEDSPVVSEDSRVVSEDSTVGNVDSLAGYVALTAVATMVAAVPTSGITAHRTAPIMAATATVAATVIPMVITTNGANGILTRAALTTLTTTDIKRPSNLDSLDLHLPQRRENGLFHATSNVFSSARIVWGYVNAGLRGLRLAAFLRERIDSVVS